MGRFGLGFAQVAGSWSSSSHLRGGFVLGLIGDPRRGRHGEIEGAFAAEGVLALPWPNGRARSAVGGEAWRDARSPWRKGLTKYYLYHPSMWEWKMYYTSTL